MLTRKHSIEGRAPFGDGEEVFGTLDAETATRLAMVAGDITLIIEDSGKILDVSANGDAFPGVSEWVGRNWLDTVSEDSKHKVMEMLTGARRQQTQHWRQVNQIGSAGEMPIKYVVVPIGEGGRHIALGRDERESAVIQQRLLQAQQALERDYMRMRRIESRYRLLFDSSSEPVLIVAADGHRIKEANAAAHRMLGAKPGSLEGAKLLGLFDRADRERLIAYLGSALSAGSVTPVTASVVEGAAEVTVSATGFRQHGGQFLMMRLASDNQSQAPESSAALAVIEAMPDAFVLADGDRAIVAANLAFVELVGAASLDQIRGRSLSEFIGRPGIDLELIEAQLTKHGFARNVATVVGAGDSSRGEAVELSAVQTIDGSPYTGFVIRSIGRRMRNLPQAADDVPRSVEQLSELVGQMSLKDIVRESTDLIERLCIEAALSYTSDNRASAAEILGLSRQSLYSKLHRYGLGNLVNETN
ncbi:transcriptional regulator PpsR [Erythrobacter sp. QSSC1-22B]|uniref:transcriptional regulator PpsR n=1 Tax=Erythrobacter sp. QSSC1-22B TaxID=1860125 RepID=UPI000804E099|nr:transcriptional regulator PpsR [Erythrobacter sp. QSSC1-22B]OBX20597.1 transcriptional regulator PpsR [Erythrobacter sp. QSSC1-22B]